MTALVGAGSKPARCDNDYILLILGGFGTRPYEVCYFDSPFSKLLPVYFLEAQTNPSCLICQTLPSVPGNVISYMEGVLNRLICFACSAGHNSSGLRAATDGAYSPNVAAYSF